MRDIKLLFQVKIYLIYCLMPQWMRVVPFLLDKMKAHQWPTLRNTEE